MAMFKGSFYKQSIIEAKKLARSVGLKDDYQKKVKQLSGGMKKRCSLAMALTSDPKVILLDEPSSGLDPVKRRQFWATIKQHSKGKAVLLTTHLMEEAEALNTVIAVLNKGEKQCEGTSI